MKDLTSIVTTLRKIHLSILLICAGSVTLIVEYASTPDAVKEIETLQQIFTMSTKEALWNYNPNTIIDKVQNVEDQIIKYISDDILNWDIYNSYQEFILDAGSIPSIKNKSLTSIEAIATTKLIEVFYPDRIDTCHIQNIGDNLVDHFKYQRTDPSKVIYFNSSNLSEDSTVVSIDIKLLEKYLSTTYSGGGNEFKSHRSLTRGIRCICSIQRDTVELMGRDVFTSMFPTIKSMEHKLADMYLNEIVASVRNNHLVNFRNREFEILGVEITFRILGSFIFIAIMGLLLYFLAHLKTLLIYFQELNSQTDQMTMDLLWIGLMNNAFAKIFNIITLFFLPVFTVSMFVVMALVKSPYGVIGIMLFILLITRLFSMWRRIQKFGH